MLRRVDPHAVEIEGVGPPHRVVDELLVRRGNRVVDVRKVPRELALERLRGIAHAPIAEGVGSGVLGGFQRPSLHSFYSTNYTLDRLVTSSRWLVALVSQHVLPVDVTKLEVGVGSGFNETRKLGIDLITLRVVKP